jgi:hypothetical protein
MAVRRAPDGCTESFPADTPINSSNTGFRYEPLGYLEEREAGCAERIHPKPTLDVCEIEASA